jgi:peptidyl-prolyl cis-trans isomerase C
MSVSRYVRSAFAVAAFTALLQFGNTLPAFAEDAAPPAPKVVAHLNGVDITELDVALAAQEYQDSIQQMPPDQVLPALINGIIDIRLMARAAEAAGIANNADSARVVNFARDRALRGEFLRTTVFASITEDAIKKRYDDQTAKFVPGDEIHAEHILVATEDEAKAIIAQLDQGGDFGAIAKEKSIDTGSGAQGGDLGFFGKGRMVKPFEDAAFALEIGTYTKTPVKSDFGFHIIKVLEKRKEVAPTFEQVHDQIQETMRKEAFFAKVEELRKAATIDIVPPPAPATPPPAADAPAADAPAAAPTTEAPAADAPAVDAPAPAPAK